MAVWYKQVTHQRVRAEGGEAAMGQHADMPLLPAGDLGDLAVGEPLAPEVDRLALRRRQILEQVAEPTADGESRGSSSNECSRPEWRR